MQAKDELSALVFTRVLLVRFNTEVSAKTVRRVRQKLGWRTWVVQSTDKKPKRAFCVTFTNIIFTGKFSVKTEHYPRRSFRKVGEQHRNKGQPRHRCFVSFLFTRKPFNPSLTWLVHPFPYLDISWACWQNKMAAMNSKWTRRCREDACLVRVKRNKKKT